MVLYIGCESDTNRGLIAIADKYRAVPKDARELLMMINAMEWKRRTGKLKYIPENMRQLVLDG